MKNQDDVLKYVNGLKGYQGYVQFSNRPLKDIWRAYSDIFIEANGGFIVEAHFFNGKDSIAIRQINDYWAIDETKNIPLDDVQKFLTSHKVVVKMAQIWADEEDGCCESMKVQKLKKVVFAGFEEN